MSKSFWPGVSFRCIGGGPDFSTRVVMTTGSVIFCSSRSSTGSQSGATAGVKALWSATAGGRALAAVGLSFGTEAIKGTGWSCGSSARIGSHDDSSSGDWMRAIA